MLPTLPPLLRKEEIERFRACHRLVYRNQLQCLEEGEGRTRKMSTKWRQKQQERQVSYRQGENGFWPESASTEVHTDFNTFDFSASSKAFNHVHEPCSKPGNLQFNPLREELELGKPKLLDKKDFSLLQKKPNMAEVGKQVTAMKFNSKQWRFPQRGRTIHQFASLWSSPLHYDTLDAQQRAIYYRYYA